MEVLDGSEEATLDRQRETFLKAHADEYERIRKNRDIWAQKISRFLGTDLQLVKDLVVNKTLKQIEEDYDVLTYYVPEERTDKTRDRKVMDKTSHIMFWFSISLALVAVASLLFKMKVI
ncbi:MAG: hypothetical protein M0Z77_08825 [Thermoplasmatales archaeon]|nr:hypothetical protein [Thermoplasmatales archaeon]